MPSLKLFLLLSVLTGVIYPLAVSLIAGTVFEHDAQGSLIVRDGKVVGSELIGQPFSSPEYFRGRPSATSPHPYNAAASSGSNLGPTNGTLHEAIKSRVADLRALDPLNPAPIPVDLVTTSGSGLDPHISLAAAEYQVARVARVRRLRENDVREIVARHSQRRVFHFIGEPVVNVLRVNLELDEQFSKTTSD
ncbi:MAG: potassium-transporting ATPase subunit KdpC [Deltaproteobacteria bacterium]|nr:potassium-transporting ATPase subunit KdpC [Deltaproteobacteria bacterium]